MIPQWAALDSGRVSSYLEKARRVHVGAFVVRLNAPNELDQELFQQIMSELNLHQHPYFKDDQFRVFLRADALLTSTDRR